jgi:Ca2+/Na+ antiporter
MPMLQNTFAASLYNPIMFIKLNSCGILTYAAAFTARRLRECKEFEMRSNASIRLIVFLVILLMLVAGLVLIAGRTDWYELWIFAGTHLSVITGWVVWLKKKNPELLDERMNAKKRPKAGIESLLAFSRLSTRCCW